MPTPNQTAPTNLLNSNPVWEDIDAILRQAERARTAGDTTRAHTFFARAVELNPNNSHGWAGLAATAPTLDEAIISWGYALALAPNDFDARVQLDSHIEEKLAQSGIADTPVLIALARTLAEVGQRLWAHHLLQHATELDPTNAEAWLWRAGVTDDNAETIACLEQVLAQNPAHVQARAGLAWAEARKAPAHAPASPEDTRQAAAIFDEAQRVLRAGDMIRAHELFAHATDLDPQNVSGWLWRASTTTDTDEAITCMETTLAVNPNDATAKDALWWLRIKKLREKTWLTKPAPLTPPAPHIASAPGAWRRHTRTVVLLTCAFIVIVAIAVLVIILPR